MSSAFGHAVPFEDESTSRLAAVRADLARANALAKALPGLEERAANLRREGAPYRAEDAAQIERELEEARAAAKRVRGLRLEEATLLTRFESTQRVLEQTGIERNSLPLLATVSIASPCNVSWADMKGEADVRFCASCTKEVFNLSMMTREEAEAALHLKQGKELCVRLFRRTDGTVLTQDCPVGLRRQKFWRRTKGIASAGMIAAGLGMIAYSLFATHCRVESAGSTGAVSALPP